MESLTTGAFGLNPTGNAQLGHQFYILITGILLNRINWTVIHIPSDVIVWVHVLARRNPAILLFLDKNRDTYIDDLEDVGGFDYKLCNPYGESDTLDDDDISYYDESRSDYIPSDDSPEEYIGIVAPLDAGEKQTETNDNNNEENNYQSLHKTKQVRFFLIFPIEATNNQQ